MSSLTAKALNEQIVRMRKAVEKARVRVCRRLIRQLRIIKKSKNEKKQRKMGRLQEETKACKKVQRDDVSKFALVNTKCRDELKITGKMAADERILYKLVTDGSLLAAVSEFRKQYPDWHHEVPFLLQRLGLQYRSKKKSSAAVLPPSLADEEKVEETKKTNVSGLVKKQIVKAVRKEEALAKKSKKEKMVHRTPPVIVLPKTDLNTLVVKGQGVIMRMNMESNDINQQLQSLPSASPNTKFHGNGGSNIEVDYLSSDGDDTGPDFFKKLEDAAAGEPSSSSIALSSNTKEIGHRRYLESNEGSRQESEKSDVKSTLASASDNETDITFFKKVISTDAVEPSRKSTATAGESIGRERKKGRRGSGHDSGHRNIKVERAGDVAQSSKIPKLLKVLKQSSSGDTDSAHFSSNNMRGFRKGKDKPGESFTQLKSGKNMRVRKAVENSKIPKPLETGVQKWSSSTLSVSSKRLRREDKRSASESGKVMGKIEEEGLHPSWIAKRREREKLKELKMRTVAKRIVFGDD